MIDRIFNLINREKERQSNNIEMIASENIVSKEVLLAAGSVLTNKYAEGYPGARYYGGCRHMDEIENIAIDSITKLFGCKYANVQSHSGAQANLAVFFACLNPGDTILGMNLSSGGHLTHGAKPTISGKWFSAVSYEVSEETGLINFDDISRIVEEYRPKLIIAGASSYPRQIDFAKFKEISYRAGAILMADVAHYAGPIIAGEYSNPFPHADIVTSTTHKTLRGPRGGVILTNNEELAKKIDKAVFPGVQGGPLMHIIAAKAVAFVEASTPSFKSYIHQVILNAKALAAILLSEGIDLITGGTDCHMVIIDLRSLGINGQESEAALEELGITCNKNAIPQDPLGVKLTSGIRLGTPAGTTRGMCEAEFQLVGKLIAQTLLALSQNKLNNSVKNKIHAEVQALCKKLKKIPSLV